MLCSVPARNPVSGNDDEDVLVEDELDEDEDEEDDRTGACAAGKTQDHKYWCWLERVLQSTRLLLGLCGHGVSRKKCLEQLNFRYL